eukprot:7002216-Alexandrium_andersonii.AAC.1
MALPRRLHHPIAFMPTCMSGGHRHRDPGFCWVPPPRHALPEGRVRPCRGWKLIDGRASWGTC